MNTATAVLAPTRPAGLSRQIFKIAVAVNLALTAFAVLAYGTGFGARFAGEFTFTAKALGQVIFGILFFNVLWAFVWYAVKNLLPDGWNGRLMFHIHTKNVDGVVVPILDVQASIHDDRALLVGIINHDADNGQLDEPVRRLDVEDLSERQVLKLREVIRDY